MAKCQNQRQTEMQRIWEAMSYFGKHILFGFDSFKLLN